MDQPHLRPQLRFPLFPIDVLRCKLANLQITNQGHLSVLRVHQEVMSRNLRPHTPETHFFGLQLLIDYYCSKHLISILELQIQHWRAQESTVEA
jgi:hypothetical protein